MGNEERQGMTLAHIELKNHFAASVHEDQLPFVDLISDEELAKFIRAQVCRYRGEEIPELTGVTKAMFKAHVAMMERFENTRRIKAAAGKKGAEKRYGENESAIAEDSRPIAEDSTAINENSIPMAEVSIPIAQSEPIRAFTEPNQKEPLPLPSQAESNRVKVKGLSASAERPQKPKDPYEGKGQDKNQDTALSGAYVVSRAFIDMFCKRYKAKKGIPHDGINPGKTDMLALGISNLIPRNEWEILIDAYLDKPYERNCNYYIWHFLSIKVLAVLGCGIGYFGREQVFEADGQVSDEETLVETLFAQLDEPLYSAVRLAYGVASE